MSSDTPPRSGRVAAKAAHATEHDLSSHRVQFRFQVQSPIPGPPPFPPADMENTTLVVLATDGAFDRPALQRLIVRSHDALAVCLRPSHTRYDGDAVFAVSCGDRKADPDAAGEAAFSVVGRAIEAAVCNATAAGGVPAVEDGR